MDTEFSHLCISTLIAFVSIHDVNKVLVYILLYMHIPLHNNIHGIFMRGEVV